MYATRIDERVRMLDTFALGQPRTVGAYLIKGPRPALVDCGYASSFRTVLQGLAESGVAPSDVRYIIPTHVHLDHGGAAGRLLKEMPNATVIAHERSVRHLVDPTKLVESATKVFGKAVVDLYGVPEPVPQERVTATGEESSLDLGDGLTATIMHAPGHAPHQVSVLLDRPRAVITADAVGIVYPGMKSMIPTTPPPSLNPSELEASVRKLEQTAPSKLLVPHYGERDDAEWVFASTVDKVRDWVESVRSMKNKGSSLDEAALAMERRVSTETGLPSLPPYAKVSIRTSVMGIMDYLDRNA